MTMAATESKYAALQYLKTIQTTRRNKHMDIKLNEKQCKIIDDGASQVPAGVLGKYRKFVDDLLRGVRDPDDDTVAICVWEASMRSMTSTPRVAPIRQGVHLPQLSIAQNSIANRAILAMSTVSSKTTRPPWPMSPSSAEKS
jgi:hypothetical protein